MKPNEIILAALGAGDGATYTPVQVQKLLFLIDRKLSGPTGGPFFKFVPYDYGPFDSDIYRCLDELSLDGFVEIIREPGLRWNKYRLTPEGLAAGAKILESVEPKARNFILVLNTFVRKLSFAELVGAIYKAYPEMKENSVFKG